MKKILALTDGSVYADSVYDHAAWAARRTGAAVEVLTVLDHKREQAALADFSGNIGVDARDELLEQLANLDAAKAKVAQARARAVLEHASDRFRQRGIEDVSLTSRHGTLVETVDEVEQTCDMVVIGKRGEGHDVDTPHLGANLERVIRGSRHPVLVANRAFDEIETILLCYDHGPSARKAIQHLASSPLLAGAKVHLLSVAANSEANRRKLEPVADQLRASGYAVDIHLMAGDPESVIAERVVALDIDLLVVGAYGHSRIRHLIVGSTTTELIRTCKVPLLMFR